MPPANSRATSPPEDSAQRSGTPPSYLSALRELESPVSSSVLNLAATLTTQGEDDADAENLHFLRSPIDPPESWRPQNVSDRLRRTSEERGEDRERRERLRRVMNRLSRIHDPPAYSDRIPSQNNLYDWSPANEADDEEELDHILQELRQQQPNMHPEILRVLGRSQLDAERESRNRAYSSRLLSSNQPSQSSESSLRSAAILQSVRRHPRFSARTRNYIERYISDRDSANRSTHDSESRDRASPSRATSSPFERSRYEASRQAWQAQQLLQRSAERQGNREESRQNAERDIQGRINSYRRSYIDNNPPSSAPSVLPWLEHTIKYLSRIRDSTCISESLSYAADASFGTKEFFRDDHEDFVMDVNTLPYPAESSWLAPGAVLSGSQHATTVTSTVTRDTSAGISPPMGFSSSQSNGEFLYTVLRNAVEARESGSRPWTNPLNRSHRRSGGNIPSSAEIVTSHSPQQDRWPVKVTIHAVDWETMTLSATMEAYNVPSHPQTYQAILGNHFDPTTQPPPRTSSITTYLEGEILDFRTHTFLTESFKSTAANDATYWRKLPPFQKFTDEELVRKLVSNRWLTEELSRDWILMRWKERCFVKSLKPTPHPPSNPASFSVQHPSAPNLSFSSTSSRENHYHFPAGVPEGEVGQFDDSGCGLTISGFYYVALRRSDGVLEGLYYDPQSSPYQHLKLESVNGGVYPAWGFR